MKTLPRRVPKPANSFSALVDVLERARRRSDLPQLALADSAGLLIAGAGQHAACEELGALAAHAPELLSERVARFELLGADVLLCAGAGRLDEQLTRDVRHACLSALAGESRLHAAH